MVCKCEGVREWEVGWCEGEGLGGVSVWGLGGVRV